MGSLRRLLRDLPVMLAAVLALTALVLGHVVIGLLLVVVTVVLFWLRVTGRTRLFGGVSNTSSTGL